MRMIQKKAMSNFEIIGYAVLAIVVLLIAIAVFVKLSKSPTESIDKVTQNQEDRTNECIKNPANCFQSTAPSSLSVLSLTTQSINRAA